MRDTAGYQTYNTVVVSSTIASLRRRLHHSLRTYLIELVGTRYLERQIDSLMVRVKLNEEDIMELKDVQDSRFMLRSFSVRRCD